MSENEMVLAIRCLKENGITAQPTSFTLIARKGHKPYAYKVQYHDGADLNNIIYFVEG